MRRHEDVRPGAGREAARSAPVSDARALELSGTPWRFRLSPTAAGGGDGFEGDGYVEDGAWGELPVPAHWQLHGHGTPAYTNVRFPFPVDPPHVPDENPTGEYRHAFERPADWPDGPAVIRFEGVDSCFTAWLNGTELGWSTGSRLPVEFAVGSLLRPGTNVLAVRVHQWSAASYLEDQDMWWLSGVFRPVTLIARPAGGLADWFVRTGYDHRTGAGTLTVETTTATPGTAVTLSVPGLGVDGVPADGRHAFAHVEPWSADSPYLYDATLATAAETVHLRLGFRTVETRDGVLTVNGRPVLFRGVNRHEWHPEHGRAVPYETARQDVLLMKQHNVDAVRTSHYPPDPAFLDLCDEYGLWVVAECDLETHGFEPNGWRGNPVDDPAWRDACLDRMQRTVERDKNHPSVVMWSLGNESGHGENLRAMADWAHGRDPDRPLHYEGDWDNPYVDVHSRMYATHAELAAYALREEPVTADPAADEHRRGLPIVLCEYGHAMGTGPGGLVEYQRLFEAHDRLCGGFVWEWIDHGVARTDPDGTRWYAYGGDFGEPVHDGAFVADGLLHPDRTPSPGLGELKRVVAPVRLEIDASGGDPASGGGTSTVRVANRHHAIGTDHLAYTWSLTVDGAETAGGPLEVPKVAAGEDVAVDLPAVDLPDGPREAWLTVTAVLAGDTAWAPAGHEIAWGQARLRDREPVRLGSPVTPVPAAGTGGDSGGDSGRVTLGPATFDARTGVLVRLGEMDLDGPRLDLWRAPTDNDEGTAAGAVPVAGAWRRIGLDRLRHRTVAVEPGEHALVVRTRVAPAAADVGALATYRWTADDAGAVRLDVEVTPDGSWPCPWPRVGVRLALPASVTAVEWFGQGPDEAYPDMRQAARTGRWTRTVEELQTPYTRPQENGMREDVRWAVLRADGAGGGPALRLDAEPALGLTVRRWTSHDLDAAAHPPALSPRDRVYVHLDVAQHGLGTASCGPGPLPAYQLQPRPYRFAVTFTPA